MPWIKTSSGHWILVSPRDPRFQEYVQRLREQRQLEEAGRGGALCGLAGIITNAQTTPPMDSGELLICRSSFGHRLVLFKVSGCLSLGGTTVACPRVELSCSPPVSRFIQTNC